jgi:hypothetical protein
MAFRAFVRALAPFLVVQWALLAVVIAVPQLAHVGEDNTSRNRGSAVPLSDEEIKRRSEQMLPPPAELPWITPDLR